ncbi:MAG: L,D-transpeptidase [Pseudotabrizicola sp.]|uniref:L,D-transpeptidase n=1 Tax=Pseudotabrizicola sp. TaxID=2939647 RepID=UPI00272867D7|nr:L,D-transpeptidase [Pseudotabrizicola sp.]MDO8882242.1 L,D-transpeptidase [Pseudotabrizicola sp.]MDP2080950.1 L,D-transpeptidase [Pseudotabrizicola sp.]MDZ7575094.1 L,D-transpeptidase [Pseudotabrizicola sp.]
MFPIAFRALLALTVTAGLAACVPATTDSPDGAVGQAAVAPTSVPTEGIYLATSDNGIAIPAIDPAKVPTQFQRQIVDFPSTEAPGTVIINPATKHLYFITGNNKAIRYGIAVGAAGFQWSGQALVTNRRQWPTWTPPKEMIERKPELSKWEKGQPGGPTNPLGSRALYLTTNGVDYGYRIHGTPDWWSIGKNASSGCIRMINQDVIDLYNRVPDGAKVIVLTAKGEVPKGLTLPPPAPKKKTPAAVATPAPAVATAADVDATVTPVAGTAPVMGPMSTAPSVVGPNLPTPATVAPTPALSTPMLPAAPTTTTPTTPVVTAPVTPVAPVPVVPATPVAPAAVVPASPATPAPVCAVPLVNGLCPQG